MKRAKNLFGQVVAFENLLLASKKAQLGKRFQDATAKFNLNLEKELHQIRRELLDKTYQPGAYHAFYVKEPKERMISAAPYRDRVVHHALCNVITPILEKTMISDTYANRVGKGTHKAIIRYQSFARKYPYVLKCDIRKFFPSIDHEKLKELIRKKIGCRDTLWLIDTIIDNSNPQEPVEGYFPGDDLFTPLSRRKGLPIGNLTSQWFGNYFLSPLDHFVKETLRCPGYIRYVDDFVVLAQSKEDLQVMKNRISQFLEPYRLRLHPEKSQIHLTQNGIPFLGHRVFRHHRLLKKEHVRRFRRRLRIMKNQVGSARLTPQKMEERIICWTAHASFSKTRKLQMKIFSQLDAEGIRLEKAGRVARRLLEQQ